MTQCSPYSFASSIGMQMTVTSNEASMQAVDNTTMRACRFFATKSGSLYGSKALFVIRSPLGSCCALPHTHDARQAEAVQCRRGQASRRRVEMQYRTECRGVTLVPV